MPNAIESMILGILGEFTGEDLRYAVNRKINLANLMIQFFPPTQIQFFRILAMPFSGQKDEMNTNNIIEWLNENRPDLARSFNGNPIAINWLNSNIRAVKRLLW